MTVAVSAPLSTSPLQTENLLPSLCPSEELNGVKLCDDGFSDSPASIQLSRTLSMAMLHSSGSTVTRISRRSLDDMGLTVRRAWDAAAINLQRRALTDQGLRFFTRPADHSLQNAPGCLEVRAHRSLASSWLAHPQTFTLLDNHLLRITHGQQITYLAPDAHTLYALVDVSVQQATELACRANELRPRHRPTLSLQPLVLANGFPVEV